MLRIHFIDDASGQPLCSTPESDRWLWTINRRAVTCGECAARLTSSERAPRGSTLRDTEPQRTSDPAKTAVRTG